MTQVAEECGKGSVKVSEGSGARTMWCMLVAGACNAGFGAGS